MGVTGVSFFEPNVPGLGNPAHWGSTILTLASGGFSLQKFNASDNSGRSSNAVFLANNFQLQFPLEKNKIGISVSLTPLTRSNFRVLDTQSQIIGSGSQLDTLIANIETRGNGGVNSLELGLGWKIIPGFSVGYAASLVFASIENNVITTFQNSSYQGLSYSLQTSGTGIGNRFGALVSIPRLLSSNDRLQLGAAASLPVFLNSERIQESDKITGPNSTKSITIREGAGLGEGDIQLPLEVSGGLTYQPGPELYFTAEALYQQWSEFESDFNPGQQNLMSDRYKRGFGIRYFPFVSGSDKFFSKFKYRAGISYDTGHLKINGHQIETLLFSAGIGIPGVPTRYSNSSIDISFHYGIRGTEAQNLVKESIWGLQLSLNLAELMFYRPKLQ